MSSVMSAPGRCARPSSGPSQAICVDSSGAALELADSNARHNGLTVETRKGDAFDVLESMAKESARFDRRHHRSAGLRQAASKDLPKALAAYKRLNQLAHELIARDGILVSCSCSYHVSAADLEDAIAKAARATDKHLQILEQGGQAPDHPVHPAIPETRYLKAYFCRVTDGLK